MRGICWLALALTACAHQDEARSAPVHLSIAGRGNANPSLAANGNVVAVAWSASTKDTTDVFAAVSRDGGRSFGTPVQVNDIAGDARVSSESTPRVAVTRRADGQPDIFVVWTTKRGADSRILWTRSTDGGKTFVGRNMVPGSDGPGARGWQSVAADAAGRVLVMWLDHRDVPPMTAAHHHGSGATPGSKAADDATARAAPSKLYFASLSGSAPVIITGSVCYCCKTGLVAHGSTLYGAWRHVYPGSMRNIAFTMSRDGGQTFAAPTRVSDDHWKIDGCPENGPALAVDDHGRAHVLWVTPPDGNSDTPLGAFYASSDTAMRFHPRVAMPTHGPAAHAQIAAAPDGTLIAAWDEIIGTTRHVSLARLTPKDDGSVDIERLPDDTAGETGWPVLASTPSRVFAAWVSTNGSASEIIVSSLR